jgi:DNA replication protein DnaC
MKIVNFLNKPTNFMVYCGGPGIGKTHLCAALVPWALEKFRYNWRYWTENDLFKRLRQDMDRYQGDYMDNLKHLIDDDFLIIDDVGSSVKSTEWREEILFALLDKRYNSMQPTMITSNFLQKEFLEKYHSRIHSRLFSNDNIIIEIADGVDFRLQELSKLENKIENHKG